MHTAKRNADGTERPRLGRAPGRSSPRAAARRWTLLVATVLLVVYELNAQVVTPGDSTFAPPDSLSSLSIADYVSRKDSLYSAWFADTLLLDRVVTHDELMKYYHADFADFLLYFTGFYVYDLGSYGKPITASFNGLSNAHWTVLLDDIPLNEPDNNWLNLNSISLENIERIEIYRGHSAGRYGASASAGTVRIIPRRIPKDRAVTTLKFRSVFSPFEDIGVYFGRGLGDRLQMYVGGSSKKTPGEQTVQGFSGGFFSNIQQTRYAGRSLMSGLRYRINSEWALFFHAQTNKDRFDAYGRNRHGDLNVFDFTTEGGLRRDIRDDYHFVLTRQSQRTVLQSRMFFTQIKRLSENFIQEEIPETYRTGTVGLDLTYGFRRGSHQVEVGGAYRQYSLDRIQTSSSLISAAGVFVSDRMTWGNLVLRPSMRLDIHSEFPTARQISLDLALPRGREWTLFANAGYSESSPSLIDVFWAGVDSETRFRHRPVPAVPHLSAAEDTPLRGERIWSVNSGVRLSRLPAFDRVVVSGFAHRVKDPIMYSPVHFNTDSMTLVVRNEKDAAITGIELELTRKIHVFEFSVRPAYQHTRRTAQRAVPGIRAMFTGYTSFWTLKRNMRLSGFLAVAFHGSHSGWTFQDAPQIYYSTPRNAKGGWLFRTRVTAEIGDFQLFYEAENIFRSRFTLLDGYDVTRQQWRFGLIWKLYN